jgi:hypothetical protein
MVLTHCHRYRHQQLPSSMSTQERVSSSFLPAMKYFSGRLPFALIWLGLSCFPALPLSRFPLSSPLLSPLAPCLAKNAIIGLVVGRSL